MRNGYRLIPGPPQEGRVKPTLIHGIEEAPDGTRRERVVNVADIKITGKQQSTLTDEQRSRAWQLWKRVGKYLRPEIGAQGWADEFQCDRDPEGQIKLWEFLAQRFEEYCRARQITDTFTKGRIIMVMNALDVQMVDIPEVSGTPEQVVEDIRSFPYSDSTKGGH